MSTSLEFPNQPVVTTQQLSTRIASELAAKLLTPAEVAEHFNLSPQDFKALVTSPAFKPIYADALAMWGGGLNSVERTKAKVDMALEDALLPIVSIIHDAGMTAGAKTDAFKSLTAISSHAPKNRAAEADNAGEKFVLNVSFAGDAPPLTIEVEEKDIPSDSILEG